MIADSAILSTSPWSSDQILGHDFYLHSESDVLQRSFDLSSPVVPLLDNDVELLKDPQESVDMRYMFSSLSTMSSGMPQLSHSYLGSVASSDCSDETSLDIEVNSTGHLFSADHDVQEYMNSSFLNVVNEDKLDSFPWSSSEVEDVGGNLGAMMELVTDTSSSDQPDIEPSTTTSASLCSLSRQNVQAHQNALTDTRKWSAMPHSQQVNVIEQLTKVISQHMGLREQLEVIRIINPEALVSPTDTEFVIELDCLDDEKLQQIQEYVRKHGYSRVTSSSSSSSSQSDSGSECSAPVIKRQTKRQRKNQERQVRKRQQKDQRQVMKEKRSGLFKQEEVVSLSNCKPEEVEDVDILT